MLELLHFSFRPAYFLDELFDGGRPNERPGFFVPSSQKLIARFKSGTLTTLLRRIALSVNSLNQRSTKFTQLELIGTKWHTKRGCLFSHRCTSGSLYLP